MHELGIAESGIQAAILEMQQQGCSRILAVTLRIGGLAAVDPDSMRFAFEAVTRGTPAEGARLIIEAVEPVAWCRTCDEAFTTGRTHFFQCPTCGNYSGDLRQGREIELARLELD